MVSGRGVYISPFEIPLDACAVHFGRVNVSASGIMGIPGLTTFVDENSHLLTDLELHDTKLLIDGNNLYHFLYYFFKIPTQYGGDYSEFENGIRYFFETLSLCRIWPHVIFDGALDREQKKFSTCIKRAKNRLQIAESLSLGQRGKMLPVLAFETFRCVLIDLDIPHVTCDYEADNQIAALGSQWGCPVLTNDSDFFIYDLKGGYIVLDYLNLHVHTKEAKPPSEEQYSYLSVEVYYFNTFMSQLSTEDKRIVPLFATSWAQM